MDNKAQVSFEYFTIIALLILISALILVTSTSLFSNKDGFKNAAMFYQGKIIDMLG